MSNSTGEVFGEAPNVAARVQATAEPGSVLITVNVQRQVAGLFVAEEQGARDLKGVSAPVQLFRIVRASGGGRRGVTRALTPFVGREEELSLLARRWERARAGEGQLALIVGEPGLGKSRLIEEFHARLAETPHTWAAEAGGAQCYRCERRRQACSIGSIRERTGLLLERERVYGGRRRGSGARTTLSPGNRADPGLASVRGLDSFIGPSRLLRPPPSPAALRDQPCAALVARIDPQPVERDAEPVADADQEIDMGKAP